MGRPAGRWVTRAEVAFVVASLVSAAVVTWYNWEARGMQGLLPLYRDFAAVIRAGFDPTVATSGTPTFPIWGYGWLFLVTDSKVAMICFQQVLAVFATVVLIRHVGASGAPRQSVTLLRALFLVAIPWYAIHSLRWPYSIAISLVTLSVVLAHRSIASGAPRASVTALSALLLGIALNFRSDAVLMPIGLAPAMALMSPARRAAARHALGWLVGTYLLLVPWAIYTHRATGHFLLTSTNGGANLFGGLGTLPDNKWGITMDDGDPQMHSLLKRELAADYRFTSFVRYEGDRILKRRFIELVRADPGEYARKCVYSVGLIATSGCYVGEFSETSEPIVGTKAVLSNYSFPLSYLIVLLSLLVLPLGAVLAWRRRRSFAAVVVLVIAYQTCLNMCAGFLPSYSSLALGWHIANLAFVGGVLLERVAPPVLGALGLTAPSRTSATVAPPPRPAADPGSVEVTALVPAEGADLEVARRALGAVLETTHEVVAIRKAGDPVELAAAVTRARGIHILLWHPGAPVLAAVDMLALAREGCDFVATTRLARGGRATAGASVLPPVLRALIAIARCELTDPGSPLVLFRRDAFETLCPDPGASASPIVEIWANAQARGLRLGEVPIIWSARLTSGRARLEPFVTAVARRRDLRAAGESVRVRVPPDVRASGPASSGVAVAGLVAALVAPRVLWAVCLALPSIRVANYLGLVASSLVAVALVLLATGRVQAGVWVALSVSSFGPLVRVVAIAAGAVAFAARRWYPDGRLACRGTSPPVAHAG